MKNKDNAAQACYRYGKLPENSFFCETDAASLQPRYFHSDLDQAVGLILDLPVLYCIKARKDCFCILRITHVCLLLFYHRASSQSSHATLPIWWNGTNGYFWRCILSLAHAVADRHGCKSASTVIFPHYIHSWFHCLRLEGMGVVLDLL